LVTVTQLDPIAVAFSLPQRNLADALLALKDGGSDVTAALADGAGTFTGRLKFVDNAVDPSSGSIKVKAVFENRAGKLWPGAFVDVSQTVSTIKDAVVVPQAAIVQGARGTIVFVMEEGKAVLKPVKLLYAQGTDAAVKGISEGDAVVVDGKQNVRPGTPLLERAKAAPGDAAPTTRPTAP
jgi:RND family efflux transporter MFP subunit